MDRPVPPRDLWLDGIDANPTHLTLTPAAITNGATRPRIGSITIFLSIPYTTPRMLSV